MLHILRFKEVLIKTIKAQVGIFLKITNELSKIKTLENQCQQREI